MSKYEYVSWHSRMHEECGDNIEEYVDRCLNLSADDFVAYQIGEVLKFWESTSDDDYRWSMLLKAANSARDALKVGNKEKIAMAFCALGQAIEQLKQPEPGCITELLILAPKIARRNLASVAGKAEKRPGKKRAAEKLWVEWGKNQGMFKDKTEFCLMLATPQPSKHNGMENERICSINTARQWVEEFRKKYPQPSIEPLLPRKS